MLNIILIAIAYLIGSIPSAILICKAMKLPDPRDSGSGNPGATNVLRIGGKLPAALVLVADALKGFIPALLAWLLGMSGFMLAAMVLVATIGHMFPVFAKFRGGKGMSTAFGGLLLLNFKVAIVSLVVWAVIIAVTRYVSLASLITAAFVPIIMLFVQPAYFFPLIILTGLVFWRHLTNIERLKTGSESKIDLKQFHE